MLNCLRRNSLIWQNQFNRLRSESLVISTSLRLSSLSAISDQDFVQSLSMLKSFHPAWIDLIFLLPNTFAPSWEICFNRRELDFGDISLQKAQIVPIHPLLDDILYASVKFCQFILMSQPFWYLDINNYLFDGKEHAYFTWRFNFHTLSGAQLQNFSL